MGVEVFLLMSLVAISPFFFIPAISLASDCLKTPQPTEQDALEYLCALPGILLRWFPHKLLYLPWTFPEVYGNPKREGRW